MTVFIPFCEMKAVPMALDDEETPMNVCTPLHPEPLHATVPFATK